MMTLHVSPVLQKDPADQTKDADGQPRKLQRDALVLFLEPVKVVHHSQVLPQSV